MIHGKTFCAEIVPAQKSHRGVMTSDSFIFGRGYSRNETTTEFRRVSLISGSPRPIRDRGCVSHAIVAAGLGIIMCPSGTRLDMGGSQNVVKKQRLHIRAA